MYIIFCKLSTFLAFKISQHSDKAGHEKNLESQARNVYANTVKCRAIKPSFNVVRNDKTILGLNDDPTCDYEQRSIVVKQKEKSIPIVRRHSQTFIENVDAETSRSTMPDANFANEEILAPEENEINKNLDSLSNDIEGDKEISKDFMGSIGSWINDLFYAPSRRPVTVSAPLKASRNSELEKVDNDEYLKSLNHFKEQMKKKLKAETSVYLSTADKFSEFNFDKPTNTKNKKKSDWGSLDKGHSNGSSNKKAEIVKQDPNSPVQKFSIKIKDKTAASKKSTDVNNSILIKEKLSKKKGSKSNKLEEYNFVTPPDLSKSLLLNVNDQEKFSQLYKNGHLGIQETPSYKQRRTNSYQHNARCYTTNANLVKNSEAKSLMAVNKSKRAIFYTSDSTVTCSADEGRSPKSNTVKMKRKQFSELTGNEFGLERNKSMKYCRVYNSDLNRSEMKTSSEELVRYLIKKTKVSTRPQLYKKRSKSLVVESNPKNRFMQSATTSLVANVLAKKENNLLLSLKTGSRPIPENKFLKPEREVREWSAKHRDFRFEIKKVSPKFDKSSYLNDVSDGPDTQNDHVGHKSLRRLFDESSSSHRDAKEENGKNKKDDIKHILSKIDHRHSIRAKQKLSKTERENEEFEAEDTQNARFQKQHDLFKSSPRTGFESGNSETNKEPERKGDDTCDFCCASADPSDVIVLTTDIKPLSEKQPEEIKNNQIAFPEKPQLLESVSDNFESCDNEVTERLCADDKPHSPKAEINKSPHYKNKLVKTKSSQYLKEDDMTALLGSFPDLQKDESQNQRQISKNYELAPTEIRPQKTLEPALLNRSYSTTVMARNQKTLKVIPSDHPKCVLMFSEKKKECDKKDVTDKKKDKSDSSKKGGKENCGFEHPKKPGPNCDKSDFSP